MLVEVSIAIPASIVSDIPHLREKTAKIGIIGRVAAIFGITEIIVFPDAPNRNQSREVDLIETVLSYMETPQYLRKRLFKIRPELRYAGVLPPLRTVHHPLANRVKDLVEGEYREGATATHSKEGTFVDVGVEQNALLRGRELPLNTRITVRIKKTRGLEAEVASRSEIESYWGYKVTTSKLTLGKLLEKHAFDLVIATSKKGTQLSKVYKRVASRWKTAFKILVAFGAPTQGLYEIVRQEKLDLNEAADFVLNVFPCQEVETVRTEEALFVTLGALNMLSAKD